jgi:hypothetical protein
MPSVGAEQKRLTESATGTWRGEEKLHPRAGIRRAARAFGTWASAR